MEVMQNEMVVAILGELFAQTNESIVRSAYVFTYLPSIYDVVWHMQKRSRAVC